MTVDLNSEQSQNTESTSNNVSAHGRNWVYTSRYWATARIVFKQTIKWSIIVINWDVPQFFHQWVLTLAVLYRHLLLLLFFFYFFILTFAGFHWKLGQQHNCVTRFKGKVHDQIRAICCADVVWAYIHASGAVRLCWIIAENCFCLSQLHGHPLFSPVSKIS